MTDAWYLTYWNKFVGSTIIGLFLAIILSFDVHQELDVVVISAHDLSKL